MNIFSKDRWKYPIHNRSSTPHQDQFLNAFPTTVMSTTTRYHHAYPMDTDSQSIGIDNRASACISHVATDFIGTLQDTNTKIIGYNGTTTGNLKIGTIRWKWSDDQGCDHVHTIPRSYFSPEGRTRLLSPQHWAQTYRGKHTPTCTTTSNSVILKWGSKYTKTIPLGSDDNVATLYSSPGYDKFYALQSSLDQSTINEDYKVLNLEPSIVEHELQYTPTEYTRETSKYTDDLKSNNILNGLTTSKITSHQTIPTQTLSNNSQRLLRYHYRYKHAPFQHLRTLAKQNVLPKELANCDIPPCIYCIYGRATRRPWRSKSQPNNFTSMHATEPGQCVSVDILTSPTPGFIAQVVGKLTRRRYNHSTIFVDNFSGLSYIFHQETTNAEETIKGKIAFESYAHKHGIIVKQYHTDNGIFKSQKWQNHCIQLGQTLTFAGVNAHHQNGRAERRIRILQEIARTQLIHASHHWPNVTIAPLWPYALLCANHAINTTPNMQNRQKMTPLQLFSSTTIHSNPNDQQPFACPIYVLQSALQQLKPFHKWAPRSKMGIYIGTSPQHARNIALVLDTTTGLVSPQFHVVFDPTFSTSKHNKNPNTWAIRAGFTTIKVNKPVITGTPHTNHVLPANKRRKRDVEESKENVLVKSQKRNKFGDTHTKTSAVPVNDAIRASIGKRHKHTETSAVPLNDAIQASIGKRRKRTETSAIPVNDAIRASIGKRYKQTLASAVPMNDAISASLGTRPHNAIASTVPMIDSIKKSIGTRQKPAKASVIPMNDAHRASIAITQRLAKAHLMPRRNANKASPYTRHKPAQASVVLMNDASRASTATTQRLAKAPLLTMNDVTTSLVTKKITMERRTQQDAPMISRLTCAQRGRSSIPSRAPTESIPKTFATNKALTATIPTNECNSKALALAFATEICTNSEGESIKGALFDLPAMYPDHDTIYAMKSTTDPDSLYYHEAMKTSDKDKFLQAMDDEINANLNRKNISLIHRSNIPEDAILLPAVWQLRRKRNLSTGKIKRYKARLNVDGSKMIKHRDYDLTYAPVISWGIIRLILTISLIKKWPTRQIDYILAFPQAPIERNLYLKVPHGYHIINDKKDNYALKIHNNLYGQKQASRVWHEYLIQKLTKAQFQQSKHDPCVLFRQKVIYILYTDDSIITGPSNTDIDDAINAIKATGLEMTDEGEISDFLGVRVSTDKNCTTLSQEHLIDQILSDLKFQPNTKTKDTPSSTSILKRHAHSPPHDNSFHYRSIIGKLGYLEKGCRPDISYITHQCARFSIHPTQDHAKAVKWIAKYLKSTKKKGITLHPDPSLGLEVFVDADFAGTWDKDDTTNPDTARSRHGYIIKYAGCPIIWKSQLQTEFALSTTEAEYTGLSYALREAIPMINILQEIEKHSDLPSKTPKIKCRVFEDNSGAIEIASVHKYRPRTKHLNIRLHHFRDYVTRGLIEICKIDTRSQIADILTKPIPNPQFQILRAQIMGW